MKTKIFTIATICLIGWALVKAFAQNQLPATAPVDVSNDEIILALRRELNIKEQKSITDDATILRLIKEGNSYREQLVNERKARAQQAPLPIPYPDFVHARYGNNGIWTFWLSDTNKMFALSSTNCLVLNK